MSRQIVYIALRFCAVFYLSAKYYYLIKFMIYVFSSYFRTECNSWSDFRSFNVKKVQERKQRICLSSSTGQKYYIFKIKFYLKVFKYILNYSIKNIFKHLYQR